MTNIYEDNDPDLLFDPEDYIPFEEEKKKPKKTYKSKKSREIDEENSLNFWKTVLSHVVGRREIWNILQNDTKAFEDRFACGPNGFPNPEATWFHAGEKAVGMRLYIKMMAIDPASIVLMHKENDHRVIK